MQDDLKSKKDESSDYELSPVLFECFNCLHRSVVWESDFTFEDYGYVGEGIVHNLYCCNCGAEIEYRVPFESEDEDEESVSEPTP